MRRYAGVDHYSATGLNTHTCTFKKTHRQGPLRANTASLNIGGEADAHELTLSAFLRLLSTQVLVVRHLQGFIQRSLVVATIINSPSRRLIWELVWLDKIHPAYLHRVLAEFARQQVHASLYDIGGLRTACPTNSIGRSRIRENKISAEMYHRDVICAIRHV